MHQKDISKALAKAMKKDGYELDGADRLIIRNAVSGCMADERRRDNNARSAAGSFKWKKPENLRRS